MPTPNITHLNHAKALAGGLYRVCRGGLLQTDPQERAKASTASSAVSDTVLGWGSRPLVFFARYLAGRLERPAVLPCVVQTSMVSPFGVEQALRYHSLGPLESGTVQPT